MFRLARVVGESAAISVVVYGVLQMNPYPVYPMPDVVDNDAILRKYAQNAQYLDKPLLEGLIGVTELRKKLVSHAVGKVWLGFT